MTFHADFESIVDQFSERVYNHAYRMLGNREDAEEATQDVFLRVYRGLSEFRGDAQFSTWIWRITVNVCLTLRGKKKPETVALETEEYEDCFKDTGVSSNPQTLLMEQEQKEALGKIISKLPAREAAAISLFYLDDMGYEEIAEVMNIPPGSVATALHRGRERLRALFLKKKEMQ